MNNNCNQDTYKNNQHPDKYYYDYYYRNYGTNNHIELYTLTDDPQQCTDTTNCTPQKRQIATCQNGNCVYTSSVCVMPPVRFGKPVDSCKRRFGSNYSCQGDVCVP